MKKKSEEKRYKQARKQTLSINIINYKKQLRKIWTNTKQKHSCHVHLDILSNFQLLHMASPLTDCSAKALSLSLAVYAGELTVLSSPSHARICWRKTPISYKVTVKNNVMLNINSWSHSMISSSDEWKVDIYILNNDL